MASQQFQESIKGIPERLGSISGISVVSGEYQGYPRRIIGRIRGISTVSGEYQGYPRRVIGRISDSSVVSGEYQGNPRRVIGRIRGSSTVSEASINFLRAIFAILNLIQ